MSDSEFYFPTRYDATLADEGVWMPEIVDELGQSYGKFKVALLDETTPRHAAVTKRLQNKYAPLRPGKPHPALAAMSQMELAIEVLVEVSIVDWELKDGKGDLIEFTKAKAIKYLNEPRAQPVFIEISEFVRNVLNFQPKEQDDLPEGN